MFDDEPDLELEDIREQAEIVKKLTPREFAKLHGIAPQMVYYWIRNGKLELEHCICGRRVLDVPTAEAFLQTRAEARRKQS